MKEELSIDIIGLAGACSYALDCIEAELVNIKNKHGKRVAYISIRILQSSWVLEMLKTLDIRAKITKQFRYNSNICCVLIYL